MDENYRQLGAFVRGCTAKWADEECSLLLLTLRKAPFDEAEYEAHFRKYLKIFLSGLEYGMCFRQSDEIRLSISLIISEEVQFQLSLLDLAHDKDRGFNYNQYIHRD